MTGTEMRPHRGVLAVSGYGLRIAVERGHLTVEDGAGRTRRRGRFSRVTPELRRLVIHGSSGTVSLDAMRWLHDVGATFIHVAHDGEVIASGNPHTLDDVKLRRAQAFALAGGGAVSIARDLIREKIVGQALVIDRMGGHASVRRALADAGDMLGDARSLDHVRFIESRAAAAYWGAWEALPVHFAGRDAARIPAHWRTVGTRRSALAAGARKATTPANALLNYLYAILEAEARLAALAVGCDPALGVLHVDKNRRDSLACDLMEPVRPHVDARIFQLLTSQTFAASDFFETREGQCRLMPPIARPLAATASEWARAVAPVAEWVGGAFRRLSPTLPTQLRPVATDAPRYRTPLTGANRMRHRVEPTPDTASELPRRCRGCGCSMGKQSRAYCDACLPAAARTASAKGVETQRQLRAVGLDARSGERARVLHAAHSSAQAAAQRAWEAAQAVVPSRATFRTDVLPVLARVPSAVLAAATGLSRQSCTRIRGGRAVPHPRHWDALRRAARQYTATHDVTSHVETDPAFFARAIAPHLRGLGAQAVASATGLSHSYSRRVIAGHHVPAPSHWPALLAAVRQRG